MMHYSTVKALAEMVKKAVDCSDELEKVGSAITGVADTEAFREAAMKFEEEFKVADRLSYDMYYRRMVGSDKG